MELPGVCSECGCPSVRLNFHKICSTHAHSVWLERRNLAWCSLTGRWKFSRFAPPPTGRGKFFDVRYKAQTVDVEHDNPLWGGESIRSHPAPAITEERHRRSHRSPLRNIGSSLVLYSEDILLKSVWLVLWGFWWGSFMSGEVSCLPLISLTVCVHRPRCRGNLSRTGCWQSSTGLSAYVTHRCRNTF